ncbi:DUF4876 domain-containing protein [Chitinophaga niabensis]|uniref:DUF4876 domain-containing protein n=1 Tax=Chitinophaga niabensis TaxID=536979 RepID=UPI0031BAA355
MRKLFNGVFIAALSLAVACKKDTPVAQPVTLTVKVSYNTEDKALNLPVEKSKVTISNNTNGQTYNAETNAQGEAVFQSIAPGNYSATVTLSFTAANYTQITGIPVTQDVQFNSSKTGTAITQNTSFEMVLSSGRIGNLVIKQLYYAGSHTSRGASFRDQFVEIYNNSNEVIYMDSLYIGNGQANNTKLSAGGVPFDWSKSIDMPTNIGNPTKDYVYARYLFMIPGTGKQYPLNPGESMVLAQTGINHGQIYNDQNGDQISIIDPTLTVDLSNAAFETNLVEYNRAQATDPTKFKPYRYDLDNPAVKNMEVVYAGTYNDWVFDATGREDLFIFKTNEDPRKWKSYPDPEVLPGDLKPDTKHFPQIPARYILDAMEIIHAVPASRIPKRLQDALDAAGVSVTGGQYSSQSLVRKTLKTVNGRRILQDTNNSANDFVTKTKADPSRTAASFEP